MVTERNRVADDTAAPKQMRLRAGRKSRRSSIDTRRTEQVRGNLVNNAIKYSLDGGEVAVTVRVHPERGVAEVAIRDSDIGIPQGEQATLFSHFARARNARNRGIIGTGLGLYLSRELVEGQGTTFHVELPLAAEDGTSE